jgi:hypothetical protein
MPPPHTPRHPKNSPVSTKKPTEQNRPDRKELKGKEPTVSMYRTCAPGGRWWEEGELRSRLSGGLAAALERAHKNRTTAVLFSPLGLTWTAAVAMAYTQKQSRTWVMWEGGVRP